MEEHNKQYSLLQPLIIPISNPSSSSYLLQDEVNQHNNYDTNKENLFSSISEHNIILRIILVLFVALISLWANYEASKIFDITIVNDIKDSPAGRRFDLFYASNDKATRIVLNTSSFVENLLYPNNNNSKKNKKKHIASVTLRLARRNLNTTTTTTVSVAGSKGFNSYVIDISPILLEDENFDNMAIVGAVQRAMSRVWLWDGGSRAPLGLVNGMAEYVAELAGFRHESLSGGGGWWPECEEGGGRWWEDKNPRHVARLINYCENYTEGFIQRLNEAMRDTWHDLMVDDVLRIKSTKLCGLYNASWLNLI